MSRRTFCAWLLAAVAAPLAAGCGDTAKKDGGGGGGGGGSKPEEKKG